MKIKDFTINALKIAGVTEEELSILSSAENIDSIDLPDELIGKFNSGVLSLNSARANPELKKHFSAQVYNGIDALIERLYTEHDISSLDKIDIDTEKSSPKKLELLTKALAKKASKAPISNDEIKTLNEQLAKVKSDYETQILNKDLDFSNRLTDMQINNYLATKNYANIPDKEIAIKIAKEYLNKAQTERGATLVNDNGTIKVKRSNDVSLDYYDNNKAISFTEFTDGVLAQNNLLELHSQTTTASPVTPTKTITTANTDVNMSVIERNKATLEAMKQSF